MAIHILLGGVDFGPNGNGSVTKIATTKGSGSRNGDATITLVFDYAYAYNISSRMEVQVYDLVGGTANGIFGGFVVAVESNSLKGTIKRVVTVKCVDYNVLWDAITRLLASPLTISADTLPNQLTALFHGFQWQGYGSVSKDINTTNFVTNITGGTTLPLLVIPGGQTFRQGMRALMANVQIANAALRPRYGLMLESDGAGGVQASLMLVDGAATPTPVAAFAETPTGGQRNIYEFKRMLDSSMPMVNARQSRWHTTFGDQFASYTNATSGNAYPNPYANNGLTGAKGYWTDVPLDDKDSHNGTDALNKLTQLVEAVEYPRETTTLTYDKLAAETLFIKNGQAVTVTWPPDQLVAAPYIVTGVAIAFPVMSQESYERVTLTLGLPRLELGEDGTDGLAGPPHEIVWAPVPPTGLALDTSYGTSGYTWQGLDRATSGWTWIAPAGRQPSSYRVNLHRTDAVQNLFVVVPGDTVSCSVPNMVVGGTYTPSVVAIFNGQESDYDVIPNITVPAYALPAAPTLGTITDSIGQTRQYAINVPVNHAALPNNLGGWVKVHAPGRGFDTMVAIPQGAPWPTTVNITVPGLAGGIAYQVSAQVADANGYYSAFCAPVVHTCGVHGPPLGGLEPEGFGGQHPDDDQTIAGWVPFPPSVIADFAADSTTGTDIGQVALKMLMPAINSITKEIESPDIEVRAGQFWVAGGTFLGDGGSAAPRASMYLRYYNQDRSAQVSTDVQIIAPTATTLAYSTFAKVQAAAVPAGARRMCVVLRGVTSGIPGPPAHTIWWSFPYLKDVSESADLAPNSVTSAAIAPGSVGAGDIAAGGVSASNQFAAGVVDSSALGSGSVIAGKIAVGGISAANQHAAGVVDNTALAASGLDAGKLTVGTLPIARIGAGNITSNELGSGSVIAGKIATGGVSASTQFAAGVVDGAAMASTINYTGIMSLNATSEANALKGRITDAQNNAAAKAAYIQHRLSSGTAAAGMGSAIEFDADSTTTQDRPVAMIAAAWTDAADATRASELRLMTNDLGSTSTATRMSIRATRVMVNSPASLVAQNAALSTTATDGFLYIPSCAGPPTGVPTAQTGTVPMVYDSTNNNLYVRNGGVWKKVALV